MCGIFGTITTESSDSEQLRQLTALNSIRGNRAYGVWVDGLIYKSAESYTQAQFPPLSGQVQLGHVLAPTGSNLVVHPLQTAECVLAHNGILLNHNDYADWVPYSVEIDSEVIVHGVQTHLSQGMDVVTAIRSTIGRLEGQQACWLWHTPTESLYLWRVMSPVYVWKTADKMSFSSIRHHEDATLLNEGSIYQWQMDKWEWQSVGTFPYHSPYKKR